MELLELDSPSYGVSTRGIYIIDDDGQRVCAGPFDSEIAAVAWIDLRQQKFVEYSSCKAPGRTDRLPAQINGDRSNVREY